MFWPHGWDAENTAKGRVSKARQSMPRLPFRHTLRRRLKSCRRAILRLYPSKIDFYSTWRLPEHYLLRPEHYDTGSNGSTTICAQDDDCKMRRRLPEHYLLRPARMDQQQSVHKMMMRRLPEHYLLRPEHYDTGSNGSTTICAQDDDEALCAFWVFWVGLIL